VKIKLFHDVCGREVLVQQVLESGGHCPWDGLAFTDEYTGVLVEALEAAEAAGGVLESALEKIAGIDAALALDRESILGPLSMQLETINREKKVPVP
jgi:hypothetical protein